MNCPLFFFNVQGAPARNQIMLGHGRVILQRGRGKYLTVDCLRQRPGLEEGIELNPGPLQLERWIYDEILALNPREYVTGELSVVNVGTYGGFHRVRPMYALVIRGMETNAFDTPLGLRRALHYYQSVGLLN